MAVKTRAEITTAVNGFLTALVTIVKHKNVVNEILDALWPTQLTVSVATGTVVQHRLDFKRQGNVVHVSGYVYNKTGNAIAAGTTLVSVTDPKYFSKSGTTAFILGISDTSQGKRVLHISAAGNILPIIGSIANNEFVYVIGSYQTND